MPHMVSEPSDAYELIDFGRLPGTPCPCGTARRALMEVGSVPYSLHLTEISADARKHYHKTLTETYFIVECEPGAVMELGAERIALEPHMAITIHPGTRHRVIGKSKVVIVASPKFNPADEWFD